GNHDVLVFGNFIPDEPIDTVALVLGAKNAIEHKWYWKFPLRWISRADWSVRLATDDCAGCTDEFLARGRQRAVNAGYLERHGDHRIGAAQMSFDGITTRNHGFDLADDAGVATGQPDHPLAAPGYYAFDMPI